MLRVLPCCETGLNVSGKTRNIAIQLAMAVFTLETSQDDFNVYSVKTANVARFCCLFFTEALGGHVL